MIKNIYFVLYLVAVSCFNLSQYNLQAQSISELALNAESKGDKYYNQFAYKKAVDFYKQSLKGQKNDSIEGHVIVKIALSYSKLNQPERAIEWFKKVENYPSIELKNEELLKYAQALASSKKYSEAINIFRKLEEDDAVNSKIRTIAREQINAIKDQQRFYKNMSNVTIERANFNSEYSDFAPLIVDSLILFVSARNDNGLIKRIFDWDESNYLDIYVYNRLTDKVEPYSKTINSKLHEGPLTIFENEIIFTRNAATSNANKKSNDGVTRLQLYQTQYIEGKWQKPVLLQFNNSNFSFAHPSFSKDGNRLYFVSDLPGGNGGTDIYVVERDTINGWSNPLNLGPSINSPGDEFFPTFWDGKLFFASNGHGGLGGLDLFGGDISKGYQTNIINLGTPFNSALDDFGISFNKDGKSGYFSSNREESAFKDEIYGFKSNVELIPNYKLTVFVHDQLNNQKLNNCLVILKSSSSNILDTLSTKTDGSYVSRNILPNEHYTLTITKEGYLSTEQSVDTSDETNKNIESWKEHVALTKDYDFGLVAYVYDATSKSKLDSVHVKIIDNFSDQDTSSLYTNLQGEFKKLFPNKELNDRVSYQIKLEKEGYLGKSLTYNVKLQNPGLDTLNNQLNLGLDKLEVGADIGKLIDIQPIYFDLGKSVIREDAAKELDKIVSVMKENPDMIIELGSHTDSRGSDAFNLKLSDKRAKASASYIVSQGIDESRITGKGYGETQLINRCINGVKCSEEEHQLNRRTEFKVVEF